MHKTLAVISFALAAMLTSQSAQAGNYCPAPYKVFLKPPTQWNTPGNWSVSKPCCRGSGGDVEIAFCVGYSTAVGGAVGGCKPNDGKCLKGHNVTRGGIKERL